MSISTTLDVKSGRKNPQSLKQMETSDFPVIENTTDTVAPDEDDEEPLVTPSDTDGAESDEVGVQFYVLVCSLNRVYLAGK